MGSLVAIDEATAMKVLPALSQRGVDAIDVDGELKLIPPTFYPDVGRFTMATVLSIDGGQDRNGVDIHVQPAVARSVSGSLDLSQTKGDFDSVTVRLRAADTDVARPWHRDKRPAVGQRALPVSRHAARRLPIGCDERPRAR